jgi:hypothetical protein
MQRIWHKLRLAASPDISAFPQLEGQPAEPVEPMIPAQ